MVSLHTNFGVIKLALFADKAPATVENFLNYVKEGFYDNTIFHRVINGFMIQGGGFTPDMEQKDPGKPIKNEANNKVANKAGTVAMARTSDPHSATCQFFINVANNDFLDFSSETSQGWGYCVFGEVVEGMDVINKIKTVSTGRKFGHADVPNDAVIIEKQKSMAKGHSLFIADLHLSEQRPDITAAFLLFYSKKAAQADALYILGDLFEVWIGDDNPSPLLTEVATAIKALTAKAVPVYFCHGNRDFLLGKKFANRSGMQLLAPLTVVDLYGTPTLLMHGDSLCTLDIGYQKFRAWWDQKWWQKLILSLPLWYRQHLARKARRVSAMDKKGKTSDIMDVTPDEVPKVMAQHQVQHLIHGHTHRPAVHSLQGFDGSTAQRYVLGDWYSQSSYLDVSADGWQLHFNPLSQV